MTETTAVLMSGGVDSSVAALLLREEGYELVGVTLQQIPPDWQTDSLAVQSRSHIEAARSAAKHIGIPHEVVDVSNFFLEEVIEPFFAAYQSARTPNPCFSCNPRLKFGKGFEIAQRFGAECLATGHYARIVSTPQGRRLAVASDPAKDQSYFLAGVFAETLEHIRFPIGELTKEQVRSIARKHRLPVAEREESQEICFVADGDVHSFLAERQTSTEGEIVDGSGTGLGRHRGIVHYTVGQRRGLNLAGGPYYVKALDPARNRVIVGRHEDLLAREVRAVEANYLTLLAEGIACAAKIRSRHRAASCTVISTTTDSFTIRFDEPQWGVAPGQALVLYEGEYVLAGGIISSWVPAQSQAL
ncbi:MAG: tRNA 2-thiouridine(34) synthase MnmA [bacterium]